MLDREYLFSIRHLLEGQRVSTSTCFYTSFLSCDFLSFCTDSLYTCSYSYLSLHTRHLFAEIAYQITQVPQEFDTRFLPFYNTCAIRCTFWTPNNKCGRPSYISSNCANKDITYFNCRQKDHIQRDCPYHRKEQNDGSMNDQIGHPKAQGRVFTLNGAKASKSKDLIQG